MVELNFHYFHFWKRIHFNESMSVINHLVEGLEQGISSQLTTFRSGPLRTEYWDVGYESPLRVQFHGPFNSVSWDLEDLMGLYLPSIQRSAILLTFYAAMEDQFFALCRSIAHFHEAMPAIDSPLDGYSPKLTRGNGIERAVRYMEEVVGMHGLRNHPEWSQVKRVGKVRNQIAHRNGRAFDARNQASAGPHISTLEVGRGMVEEKLLLEPGYLPAAIVTFTGFADEIQRALVRRFP